jgi:hypothetical protein
MLTHVDGFVRGRRLTELTAGQAVAMLQTSSPDARQEKRLTLVLFPLWLFESARLGLESWSFDSSDSPAPFAHEMSKNTFPCWIVLFL